MCRSICWRCSELYVNTYTTRPTRLPYRELSVSELLSCILLMFCLAKKLSLFAKPAFSCLLHSLFYLFVSWVWWDWPLTWLTHHCPSVQGHCGACRRKWRLTDTDVCPCGETQTMSHIVKSCPLTKLNGGLSRLHSADEDAVSWLTNYGKWPHTRRRRRSAMTQTQLLASSNKKRSVTQWQPTSSWYDEHWQTRWSQTLCGLHSSDSLKLVGHVGWCQTMLTLECKDT